MPCTEQIDMEFDQDGDLVLDRKPCGHASEDGNRPELVLSEVHMECLTTGSNIITAFHRGEDLLLEIEHSLATPLELVGLQVWRGALLLGDYLLHSQQCFAECTLLELGSGPGVAGLLAALVARHIFLTDIGPRTLHNCAANIRRNSSRLPGGGCSVAVRQLNWMDLPDWLSVQPFRPFLRSGFDGTVPQDSAGLQAEIEGSGGKPFCWQLPDMAALQQLDYILAADCIYDNDLTEALMRTAVQLMRFARFEISGSSTHRRLTLLVALEKRIAFTLRDLDDRAPAYDYWRTLFTDVTGAAAPAPADSAAGHRGGPELATCGRDSRGDDTLGSRGGETIEAWPPRNNGVLPARDKHTGCAPAPCQSGQDAAFRGKTPFPLTGRQLDVGNIPQAVREYERSEYLELWELWLDE